MVVVVQSWKCWLICLRFSDEPLFEYVYGGSPHASSIVFIKELDAVGRERGLIKGSGGKEHDATLNKITTISKSHTHRSGYIIRLKIPAASESSSKDINVASSIVEDMSGDNALFSCQWWVGEFHHVEENYLVMDLWLIFPSLEDNWKSQKKVPSRLFAGIATMTDIA
ncbi:hypothetical protein Tco_0287571 [Tanacetum coccineum]